MGNMEKAPIKKKSEFSMCWLKKNKKKHLNKFLPKRHGKQDFFLKKQLAALERNEQMQHIYYNLISYSVILRHSAYKTLRVNGP